MRTYNIAVIGGGFMGKTHSCSIADIPFYYDTDFKPILHTLCGRTAEKTERLAARLNFLHAETDFEKVISNPEIDIVDICTPNMLHYPQAKAAILAGKHVYCDKPLCVTALQARELAQLAESEKRVCQVTFQHRFWPAVLYAKQLIRDGAIGDIISFRAMFLHSSLVNRDKAYAWRNAPISEGGGVLNDLGSHLLDLIMFLCGDIEDISSVTQTLYGERRRDGKTVPVSSDDAAFMLVRLKNGACGTAEASKLATGLNDVLKLELHGKSGALMFDLTRPGELKYYAEQSGGFTVIDCLQKYPQPCDFLTGSVLPGWIRAHIHSYFSFLQAVDGARPASPSFAEAAHVQEIIEKARSKSTF